LDNDIAELGKPEFGGDDFGPDETVRAVIGGSGG